MQHWNHLRLSTRAETTVQHPLASFGPCPSPFHSRADDSGLELHRRKEPVRSAEALVFASWRQQSDYLRNHGRTRYISYDANFGGAGLRIREDSEGCLNEMHGEIIRADPPRAT